MSDPNRGYSLLRSKTFWTMMLMLAGNSVDAVKPVLSPDQIMVANLALTGAAAMFHSWTGNSTSGSN